MTRSRRSFQRSIQPNCMQIQNKRQKTHANIQEILHTERTNLRLLSQSILKAAIRRIVEGVWYRILPNNGSVCDDLASAIGQEWEETLPMLSNLKLVSEVKGKLEIRKKE